MRWRTSSVVGELHELLDQPLAAVVGRVGLAGDHELDRPLGVGEQRLEPLGVAQHEREPLVRRHAAGEADRQHVGVEHGVDPAELGVAGAAVDPRLAQPRRGSSSTRSWRSTRLIAQSCSSGVLAMTSQPSASSIDAPCARSRTCAGHPRRRVHAVGDRRDRHVVAVESGPQAGEHAAGDLAVQQADAVGALRQPQAHDRHVEHGRVAALEGLGTELEDAVDRHARRGVVAAEVLRDEVDAGSGRCRPGPGCAW